MPTPPISEETLLRSIDAYERNGRNASRTADELGIPRTTLQSHMNVAERRGLWPPADLWPRRAAPASAKPFVAPDLPASGFTLDEILARRRVEAQRNIAADAARKLIPITIKTPGPIGLAILGDPHIDDPGSDFPLLERHLELCAARPGYLFSACVGDFTNSWTGRLSRLYGHQNTTVREAWQLVEWFARRLCWLFMIRGNHDCWQGDSDPLDWILRDVTGVDERHGVRLALNHPGAVETRLHGRHDFKGHSQYNGLHGLVKETLFGDRDHIILAGHRHFGADAGEVMPDGVCTQLVRVSGYKVVDDYAVQGGFKRKPIHPAALIVIDPSRPETSRDRAWCAPSFEEGVEYLDWKRARFEGTARVVVKAAGR